MINDIKQQINEIQELIKAEQDVINKVPEFLKQLVIPKKQAMIESLQKQVLKLKSEISKIEEKQKLETEKESKIAPYKKIIAEINSLKFTVEEKSRILAQAKGAYQTNTDQKKSAELNLKYKNANEDFFKAKTQLEEKITESKVLKENLKAS